jgi:RNA recognition motif-containing protein
MVHIKNYDVYIYKINNNNTELVEHFITKKIFIGDKTKDHNTFTILLFIDKNNYIMINENGIEKLNTNNDEIIKYYSLSDMNYAPYSIGIGKKFIYFFGYPDGYLPLSEFPKIKNKNDLLKIFNESCKLEPFLYSLYSHKMKNNKITLEEFKEIQKKTLDEISLNKIKELAKIYGVTTSGSKKDLVDRIEKLRNVIVYKKI